MQMETMPTYTGELLQLTAAVCDAVLGMPAIADAVAPADSPALLPPAVGVSARVDINGPWRGEVSLHCDPGFAGAAADAMFPLGGSPATPADLRDALGEWVNMIGGNFKALLPEGCRLSLPVVAGDAGPAGRTPDDRSGDEGQPEPGRVVACLPLSCGGHRLAVRLAQRS